MQDEINKSIGEIRQMREQYAAEVGEGRRVWPKSIKERIIKLGLMGLKPKEITSRTGVPYETVCQWRYSHKENQGKTKFHNLAVTVPAKSLVTKNATVTVKSQGSSQNATVTVTTPDGYLIEGLPADLVIEFIRSRVG